MFPGRPSLLAICLMAAASAARGGTVQIAVAANFTAPLEVIVPSFTAATGHRVLVSSGSSGVLFAQIVQGAPFDVLLAADQEGPARLEREGLAVPGTRRTYAVGRLVLWSGDPELVDGNGEVLHTVRFRNLSVADPELAPYGAAAAEVLKALGLGSRLSARLVTGQNVAQAFAFVASGSAELGFVARAQVWRDGQLIGGSAWLVPAALHHPLRQDAVLLTRAMGNPAAAAFLRHLAEPAVIAIITSYGYEQEPLKP